MQSILRPSLVRPFLVRNPPLQPFAVRNFFTKDVLPPKFSQLIAKRFFSRPTYYNQGNSRKWGPGGSKSPWEKLRDRFNRIDATKLTFGLIGCHALVFGAWYYAEQVLYQYRDASLLMRMVNNFSANIENMKKGRLWTLVTSTFSPESLPGFLFNAVTLFFMAPTMIGLLGNTGFMALYLFCGAVSSSFSVMYHYYSRPYDAFASKAASAALNGLLAFFAAAFPQVEFLVFFVLPVQAWICVSGFFVYDIYRAIKSGGHNDAVGRIGGVLAGLFWFARKRVGFF